MKLILIPLLVFAISLSCTKEADPILDDGIPNCILNEIENFKNSTDPCDLQGPSVKEFLFQENIVYAFDMGQCISDGGTKILSKNCDELCILGTILGITDCLDEAFANAEEIRTIWEN